MKARLLAVSIIFLSSNALALETLPLKPLKAEAEKEQTSFSVIQAPLIQQWQNQQRFDAINKQDLDMMSGLQFSLSGKAGETGFSILSDNKGLYSSQMLDAYYAYPMSFSQDKVMLKFGLGARVFTDISKASLQKDEVKPYLSVVSDFHVLPHWTIRLNVLHNFDKSPMALQPNASGFSAQTSLVYSF